MSTEDKHQEKSAKPKFLSSHIAYKSAPLSNHLRQTSAFFQIQTHLQQVLKTNKFTLVWAEHTELH